MKRTSRAVLVSLLFLAGPWIWGASAQTTKKPSSSPSSVLLTILHTNDTHSHLLPFSYPELVQPGSVEDELEQRNNIGGIARRATLVRQIREKAAASHKTVWLVDAGDFSDGTPFSTEYFGKADVEAMNAAGYDFGTLGNHEFNIRFGQLKEDLALAKFPIISSNVTDPAGKPFVQEYVVKNIGRLRIGLFGLMTREAATYPAAKEGGLRVADEIETARRMVALLRKKADIIIAISHAGKPVDELIADKVPGIDVIIGGHSHSRLYPADLWPKSKEQEIKPGDVEGTVIVQAYQWGGELGRLDLLFQRDNQGVWHVGQFRDSLIPVTADYPDDPKVAAVVEQYWRPIAPRYAEVIGQAAGDFTMLRHWDADSNSFVGYDDAQYNLVADAIREMFGADFDLENTGGVRAPLGKGNITMEDAVEMDPFSNTVILFKISGRDLKQLLARYRPYVSGLRYRVQDMKLVEASINGSPIEDGKVYSGATNSYFAQSAFAQPALKGIERQDTKRPRFDVFVEYVKKKGTLKPAYDGRRIVITSKPTTTEN